jgi:hypothetical protein
MRLLKARLRGPKNEQQTDWFTLADKLTIIHSRDRQLNYAVLQLLESINPPYPSESLDCRASFPITITIGKYRKIIDPAKRTIAIAVFSGDSSLARELGELNPVLYEIDRIEVGRRLDSSRWLNFVELASSTRLAQITDDLRTIQKHIGAQAPEHSKRLDTLLASFAPTDRIKLTLQKTLQKWLRSLPDEVKTTDTDVYASVQAALQRADHFDFARQRVLRRLPLVVNLTSPKATEGLVHLAEADKNFHRNHHRLLHLCRKQSPGTIPFFRAIAELAIAFSTSTHRAKPILLADAAKHWLQPSSVPSLPPLLHDLAGRAQCIATVRCNHFYPDIDDAIVYDYQDLIVDRLTING